MVSHFGIDIKSINIVQAFLDSTHLFQIPDLVKSPVQVIVVAIVISDAVLDMFPDDIPAPIHSPPFQCFSFHAQTNVCESLFLVAGLGGGEVIVYLENPSF